MDSLHTYSTSDERAYLDALAKSKDAALLLSNYIAAAGKRVVWNGIDKTEVLLYAELLLGNAQAAAQTATRLARAA